MIDQSRAPSSNVSSKIWDNEERRAMLTSNPFAELSATISPGVMQTYVVAHDAPGRGRHAVRHLAQGQRQVLLRELAEVRRARDARRSAAATWPRWRSRPPSCEVLTSSEFCNQNRRIAHLLTMYGFLIYVITTAIMVFSYPTPATPTPGYPAVPVVRRRADGLCRRLLVLVLHPRRCRRRRQLAVPHRARRPVHPVASRERARWGCSGRGCRRPAARGR